MSDWTGDESGTATLDPDTGRRVRERAGIRLCLLHHPDPSRVGACVWLEGLEAGVPALLGRSVPEFQAPGGGPRLPVGDPYVSRKCGWLRWVGDSLELSPIGGSTPLRVDGKTLTTPLRVSPQRLDERGVQIDLAGRVLVYVDRTGDDEPGDHGFVGVSRAARDVRKAIRSYAPLDLPLLVFGEAGCGKDVVVRALRSVGSAPGRPWINFDAGAASRDARQRFTAALRSAQGGTLVVDRIGELDPASQEELLDALRAERAPDGAAPLRVIGTSEHDPEELVHRGRMTRTLLDRLQVGLIHVPPLRHRRADIALLLHRFLAHELAALAASERLTPASGQRRPWLTLDLVHQLVAHPFPGNVRELRNLCTQIAVHSSGLDRAEIPPAARERLRRFEHWKDTGEPSEDSSIEPIGPPRLSASRVREVLSTERWNLAAAARELGVARNTLVAFMERTPGFRRVKDIPETELRAAIDRLGDDAETLADELEVSIHGLRIRLSDLDDA